MKYFWLGLFAVAIVAGWYGGKAFGFLVTRLHIKYRLRRILKLKGV